MNRATYKLSKTLQSRQRWSLADTFASLTRHQNCLLLSWQIMLVDGLRASRLETKLLTYSLSERKYPNCPNAWLLITLFCLFWETAELQMEIPYSSRLTYRKSTLKWLSFAIRWTQLLLLSKLLVLTLNWWSGDRLQNWILMYSKKRNACCSAQAPSAARLPGTC